MGRADTMARTIKGGKGSFLTVSTRFSGRISSGRFTNSGPGGSDRL
jgi:hypothetical protein